MLLIPCPYCGWSGRRSSSATAARRMSRGPPTRAAVDDEAWAELPLLPRQPEGPHAERWRHVIGCGRFFNCAARHRERPHPRRPTRPASRGPISTREGGAMTPALPRRRRRASTARARCRFTFDGKRLRRLRRRHARLRAARQRRPSRRPLATSIIARAASSPPAPRSRTRSSASRAAPGASRRTCARPQVELYDGLVATSQNRWPSLRFDVGAINDLLVAAVRRRLLLQDLHGAEAGSAELGLDELFEPVDPRTPPASARRRRQPDPDRYARYLRPLRRAGRRRRARRGSRRRSRPARAARASIAVRRAGRARRLAAGRDARRRSTACRRRDWLAETLAALRRHAERAADAAHQAFGYYAQNFVGLDRARRRHRRCRDAEAPRERLWQVRAKRGRAGDRRDRAAAGVPRQRPARA